MYWEPSRAFKKELFAEAINYFGKKFNLRCSWILNMRLDFCSWCLCESCIVIVNHSVKLGNFIWFPGVEILQKGIASAKFWTIRPKLCGNWAFAQNMHTRKLGEITVMSGQGSISALPKNVFKGNRNGNTAWNGLMANSVHFHFMIYARIRFEYARIYVSFLIRENTG